MKRRLGAVLLVGLVIMLSASAVEAQEARRRWERMNQIRLDKFDRILPAAMRENGIDMWITMIREANYKTLHADFGQGYASDAGFYVFTDRGGERIERISSCATSSRIVTLNGLPKKRFSLMRSIAALIRT